MSDMEVFYGRLRKSVRDVTPEDTDEFYDLEEKLGLRFVKVDGILYEFEKVDDLDIYGFQIMLPPSDEIRFICFWYNGGAGLHEVVESLIKSNKEELDYQLT